MVKVSRSIAAYAALSGFNCALVSGLILPSSISNNFPSRFQSGNFASTRGRHVLFMSNDMEALAKEGSWAAYLDNETTGLIYYFNEDTGESTWDPPTPTFPQVRMSKRKKDRMTEIRKQYNDKLSIDSIDAIEEESSGDFFSNFFGKKAVDEKEVVAEEMTVEEEEEEEEEKTIPAQSTSNGGFLSNLFPSKKDDAISVDKDEAYDQAIFEDAVIVDDSNKPIKIEIASKVLPHPEKVSWGGEDAIFVQGRTFGVFDGVSGADKLDGVPLYSTTLAKQLKADVGQDGLSAQEMKKKLLDAAEFADASATGASTAVVASIGEDGLLQAVNLGDSVLLVVRDGSIISRTREIVHYFECPFQLSEDSPDRPKDSTVLQTKISPGDIIVAGSDGVFDNLDDAAICEIVVKNPTKPSMISKAVVEKSRKVSLDPEAQTPYAKQAQKNRYPNFRNGVGGKVDDISCVVVRCT